MAPNPSAPGKAGICDGTEVNVSVTLIFGVSVTLIFGVSVTLIFGASVGEIVTTGFGAGEQPVRFTENNIRSPRSRNKKSLGLIGISLPYFDLRFIDIEKSFYIFGNFYFNLLDVQLFISETSFNNNKIQE